MLTRCKLVIPKLHGMKLTDIPDDHLTEILVSWLNAVPARTACLPAAQPVAKRLAVASGCEQFNLLQNNGRMAHQMVDHVHFHVVRSPSLV